jgi:hypothetical protein
LAVGLLLAVGPFVCAQTKLARADAQGRGIVKLQPLEAAPGDDELRKLQKERYNEALSEVQGLYTMYQAARTSLEAVADAGQRLVKAGLDVGSTPAEKVALLTKYVELARLAEEIAKARQQSARGTGMDVHRARYQRLDAEIQLLRAKREMEKGAKK